jgi:segregation and condensation protein A
MKLLVGQGMNNFIVEWNENREADVADEGISDQERFEQDGKDVE